VGVVYRRDAVFFDSVQKRSDVTGGSQPTTSRSPRLGSAELLCQPRSICAYTWVRDVSGARNVEVCMTKTWTWSRQGWVCSTPDPTENTVVAESGFPTEPSLFRLPPQ
jgi:hypothetical protein